MKISTFSSQGEAGEAGLGVDRCLGRIYSGFGENSYFMAGRNSICLVIKKVLYIRVIEEVQIK